MGVPSPSSAVISLLAAQVPSPTALTALLSVDPFGERARQSSGAAVLALLAFVISFLAIRTSARLSRGVSWWPGTVRSGGVHLHHLVWGICLMMLSGFLGFAATPGTPLWHVVAIMFGVGAGFTMDEFALWVRLEDVYWKHEGRASIDAVIVSVAFAALVVLGTTPFGLSHSASVPVAVAVVAVVLGLSIMCFIKGRVLLGVTGLFVPVMALVGAMRLGQPASPWARRRYSPERLARAQARFALDNRLVRLRHRVTDALTGALTVDGRRDP